MPIVILLYIMYNIFYHRRVFIVTGRTELELPDTRKRMGNKASYVDVYPFIWNEFKKHGYVTGKYNILSFRFYILSLTRTSIYIVRTPFAFRPVILAPEPYSLCVQS